ncbi:hypothetical protein BOTCAL_0438g00030 [Botryotinia calthae]|uniref:Uncharacterized protein n=1 Tax=Botryotinia calthae TaxID=38488 RepID=A0A4Y8CNL9_9HELO|nr:hypothetical protein BOTCAL_0438g00030 [Botryotinia calthae]
MAKNEEVLSRSARGSMENLCSLSSTSSTKAPRILPSGLMRTMILPVVFMLQLSLMMYSAPKGEAGVHIQAKKSKIGNMWGILKRRKNKWKSYDPSVPSRYMSFLGRKQHELGGGKD